MRNQGSGHYAVNMTTFNTILLLVLVLSCIMAQTVKRGPSYKLQIEYSGETFFDGLVLVFERS